MRDIFVDVECEFDSLVLASEIDPARVAIEQSREVADRLCAQSGARLRTDRPPEVIIRKAVKAVTGQDVTLVASRWAVTAPDRVEATH